MAKKRKKKIKEDSYKQTLDMKFEFVLHMEKCKGNLKNPHAQDFSSVLCCNCPNK